MIKYLELTAPEADEFRQVKILSVEISEGDQVEVGDTLFKVRSGDSEIALPATKAGRIVEVIALTDENISVMTPLLLLETEVQESTATVPIIESDSHLETVTDAENETKSQATTQTPANIDSMNDSSTEKADKAVDNKTAKKTAKRKKKNDESKAEVKQQSFDLDADQIGTTEVTEPVATAAVKNESAAPQTVADADTPSLVEVRVPDIGGDSAKVIEILVAVGQAVAMEDSLITLESDKASMEVPSSVAGIIHSIEVSIDQDVAEGVVIVTVAAAAKPARPTEVDQPAAQLTAAEKPAATIAEPSPTTPKPAPAPAPAAVGKSHASPSIRRFARELGVDLAKVSGSERKGRITKQDIKQFVKGLMTSPVKTGSAMIDGAMGGSGIPIIPAIDFSKFGEIEVQPLNKIKRLTAVNLHRSWLNVPHVTHNDETNINDLEAFRKQLNAEYAAQKRDIKLSPLAFVVKAVVNALQTYPQFNSSLDASGENLIYKKYCHIGIAVETPNGLVVPVVRDADKMSVSQIAQVMGELAGKARSKKLSPRDMSGACFTISSLGGIGGTHFTPIVNAPEVAILGVSRSKMQAVWDGSDFKPEMILPLSLSYDHRVIDGAEAARFTRHIAAGLEDVRRLTV